MSTSPYTIVSDSETVRVDAEGIESWTITRAIADMMLTTRECMVTVYGWDAGISHTVGLWVRHTEMIDDMLISEHDIPAYYGRAMMVALVRAAQIDGKWF